MGLPGVVGVGVGEAGGKPSLKVLIQVPDAELEKRIPKQLEGFLIETQAVGTIQAQRSGDPGRR